MSQKIRIDPATQEKAIVKREEAIKWAMNLAMETIAVGLQLINDKNVHPDKGHHLISASDELTMRLEWLKFFEETGQDDDTYDPDAEGDA